MLRLHGSIRLLVTRRRNVGFFRCGGHHRNAIIQVPPSSWSPPSANHSPTFSPCRRGLRASGKRGACSNRSRCSLRGFRNDTCSGSTGASTRSRPPLVAPETSKRRGRAARPTQKRRWSVHRRSACVNPNSQAPRVVRNQPAPARDGVQRLANRFRFESGRSK